jgi:predicted Zn-dependent peptidase
MMLMMAKSLLDMGSVPSLENVFQDIRKITREHIIELANDMLVDDDMSTLVFVPENGKANH